jgi:general secretion pathway protein B
MSLILEALKKSEQQRRLGEAPTLGSPVLAARRRRSLLPLLAALVAIAIGVGWWLTRMPAPPPSNAPLVAVAPAPRETPASRERAKPPLTSLRPKAAAAPPAATRAAAPNAQDRPGSLALPPAARRVTTPAIAPPKTAAPKTAAPGSAPPPASAPRLGAAPAPTATATPKTDRITPPAASRAQPARPALPSIWDLSYATRKDLPDLTLTMHVYAPDPAQRFVVIKGERHIEGDDLGGGVTLREIRADGMVLDYKGQRFVYPRDGR